jgi:soluble lytic murein transglycosylase-like protein
MTPYRSLIEAAAQARDLDPNLVEAQILKESTGNPWAYNPEPRYRYLWNVATNQPFRPLTLGERVSEEPPPDFPFLRGDRDQEWWAQQASWGLCQVMGATAREEGFRGPYLTQLCDPATNLPIGCSVLAKLLLWSAGTCGWRSRPTTPGSAGRRVRRGSGMRPPSWCSIDRSKWRIRR